MEFDYSELPRGLHIFATPPPEFGADYVLPAPEAPFDLRGLVVLANAEIQPPAMNRLFPPKVTGISIGQSGRRLQHLEVVERRALERSPFRLAGRLQTAPPCLHL